mmetsp:Transcript_182723/g.578871  ORF Transcript_182723/g.578871 Transcript_182723/m.578871 type:complete len:294 (+) Transcript_182723:1666-2547(+)
MPVVRLLQSEQFLRLLVRGIAEQPLHELEALREADRCGAARVRRLHRLQVLGVQAVGPVVLVVGRPQELDLLPMLVGRGAEHLLQVVHALGHRRVVGHAKPHVLQGLEVLVVRLLQNLQLPCMFLGGVAHQVLEVADALWNRGEPVVAVLQALQLPRHCIVLGQRVTDERVDAEETLREAINLAVMQAQALLQGALPALDGGHLLAQRPQISDEGGGLLPEDLELSLVELHLLLIQGLYLPLPLHLPTLRVHGLHVAEAFLAPAEAPTADVAAAAEVAAADAATDQQAHDVGG